MYVVAVGDAKRALTHVVEPASRCPRPARLEAVHLGRQDGDGVDELRVLGRLSLSREGVGAAVGRVAGLVEALDLRLELGEELVEVLLPVRVAAFWPMKPATKVGSCVCKALMVVFTLTGSECL